jgi:hypothetical protein
MKFAVLPVCRTNPTRLLHEQRVRQEPDSLQGLLVVVGFENGVEKGRRMGGGDASKERMRCFANDAAGWCGEDQE